MCQFPLIETLQWTPKLHKVSIYFYFSCFDLVIIFLVALKAVDLKANSFWFINLKGCINLIDFRLIQPGLTKNIYRNLTKYESISRSMQNLNKIYNLITYASAGRL